MCLVKVRPDYDDEDAVYIRRVRRPSRSETRITYSPRASARDTRTRVSQSHVVEAPRPQYVIEERPRVQYLAGPPQHAGVHIHQSAPVSREIPPPPPPAPMPPPSPVAKAKPPPTPVIVKEKETEIVVEKKVEKSPSRPAESKSRLEIVSVEHSDPNPRHSHSSVGRKHSRHGSRRSESLRGERGEHDGVIVERERDTVSRRYLVDPARRSVPDYDTYRYIEAPPIKKEVRYLLEDNPRRSTGGLFRERERERVVVDNGGSRRKREYIR